MSTKSTIVNVQYSTQAATLFEPVAAVVGYKNTGTDNQLWEFIPIRENSFIIQNVATRTYASVQSEAQCAPVIGSLEPYTWAALETDREYQISTKDGAYVWCLIGGEDYAGIVLEPRPYSGKGSVWAIEPTLRAK